MQAIGRTGGLNATQITRLPVDWLYEPAEMFSLGDDLRERCVGILKQGLASMKADMPKEDFWPAIHAAEGLALAGHGDVVIETLTPLLASETDAQSVVDLPGNWSAPAIEPRPPCFWRYWQWKTLTATSTRPKASSRSEKSAMGDPCNEP